MSDQADDMFKLLELIKHNSKTATEPVAKPMEHEHIPLCHSGVVPNTCRLCGEQFIVDDSSAWAKRQRQREAEKLDAMRLADLERASGCDE